ncbi:MAG: TonB-dependent receptor plug domain-containing protein [Bacteroidaceae bacterium]|nr:TonB-dependent receptor plug domain-containing protein [Bacteroidaceae bacterium]
MMSALLLYSIKSAIVLTLLYLPYMLMLRRESFFRFNRLVLLAILLMSLVLPLCNIPWMSLDNQPVVQAAQLQMLELGIPVHVLPEVQVLADGASVHEISRFSLFLLVSLIYIIGMVMLLAMRLWQIARLQFGLKRGVLWHNDEQGVRIYCHSGDVAPFSWMKNIVINEKDYDEAGREIVLHEMGHIQGRHSWDVVLLTLVQMLQWWNPLCYVLGISLRDVHEYEADNFVLQQGVSAQGYQLLLIRKAVGSGGYPFANSFNHSLTKKRITMMKKMKSNPWMKSKALYVIPVAALALSAFATPKFVAPIEETVTKLEGKGTENSANLQAFEEEKKKVKVEETSGTTMMRVRGTNNAQPLIVLDGKVIEVPDDAKDINSEEQLTSLINVNPEDIESITVLQKEAATAKWGDKGANGAIVINTKSKDDVKELVKKLPGAEMDDDGNITVNGKSVAKIMLEGKEVFNKNDTIYNVVEVRAKFPGGDEECFKFLSENIRYPKLCHEFGVQGRLIVRFVIEKDGSISNIEKVRGPGKELSQVDVVAYKEENPDATELPKEGQDLGDLLYEEAVRVLKLMPKWEPAKDKDGNVVRSRFNLPIMFRLSARQEGNSPQ